MIEAPISGESITESRVVSKGEFGFILSECLNGLLDLKFVDKNPIPKVTIIPDEECEFKFQVVARYGEESYKTAFTLQNGTNGLIKSTAVETLEQDTTPGLAKYGIPDFLKESLIHPEFLFGGQKVSMRLIPYHTEVVQINVSKKLTLTNSY